MGNDEKRSPLIRLADSLAEDILKKSDEEILEEFSEIGINSIAHAEKMRVFVEKAVLNSNKNRLAVAKAGAIANRQPVNSFSRPVDIAEARRRLRLMGKNASAQPQITLAARSEKELSDADVSAIFQDLIELGLLSTGDDSEDSKN